MNVKLENYLQQYNDWGTEQTIQYELSRLQQRAFAICKALDNGTITEYEANKRYKPIAMKKAGLHEILRNRNANKCALLDVLINDLKKREFRIEV